MEQIIDFIAQVDPEVAKGIESELQRQRRNIELIASENFVSEAVLAAMGTVLTINMPKVIGQTLLRRLRVCGRCGKSGD
jgi:hypothetical protein